MNSVRAQERRRQLDEEMLVVLKYFGAGLSLRAIVRDILGKPKWQAAAREMGFSERVIGLPSPLPQRSQGSAEERNSALRRIALERWHHMWPTIGNVPVNLLEALIMRTELADEPRAIWNARTAPPVEPLVAAAHRPEEAVLPYTSGYD